MEEVSITLTVYFDGQFWCGLFEEYSGGGVSHCKHVFGAEPKDAEVYSLILNGWNRLRFGPVVVLSHKPVEIKNPKVMQRKIRAAIHDPGTGTKAQQAVKLQTEQHKIEKTVFHKAERDRESDMRFEQRQLRKKERHKGH